MIDLERFRPFLTTLARILLDPTLRSKLDPADVVQHTLMDAHRNRDQFQGTTDGELKAWLKIALKRDLLDLVRRLHAEKQNKSLEPQFENTTRRLVGWLIDTQTSPSSRAAQIEEIDRLAEAVGGLPEDQRAAVEFHLIQEYSLQETAQRMGKTFGSVASLVHRGTKALRRIMGGNGKS